MQNTGSKALACVRDTRFIHICAGTRLWSHCRSYYNRANVELYMEEYQAALDDLRHAHKLDRALPAEQRIELITK